MAGRLFGRPERCTVVAMAKKAQAKKAIGPADEYQAFRGRLCDSLESIAAAFSTMAQAQAQQAQATVEMLAMARRVMERAEKRGAL